MIGVIIFPFAQDEQVSSIAEAEVPAISYLREAGAQKIVLAAADRAFDRYNNGVRVSPPIQGVSIFPTDFDTRNLPLLLWRVCEKFGNDDVCVIDASYQAPEGARIANHIRAYLRGTDAGKSVVFQTNRDLEYPVCRLNNPDEGGYWPLYCGVFSRASVRDARNFIQQHQPMYSNIDNIIFLQQIACRYVYEPVER